MADAIAKRLLALEMQLRSKSIDKRLASLEDFYQLVKCVDLLRLEMECQQSPDSNLARAVNRLERKVSKTQRSQAYKIAAWFESAQLSWYICQASATPDTVC